MRARLVSVAVAAMGLVACGDASAPVACDPFAVVTLPISLGQVLAVGKEASGTMDVVDRAANGTLRVFTSDRQMLVRRRTLGSGESGAGPGSWLVVTFGEANAPLNLQVEFGGTGPTAMALVPGPLPAMKMFSNTDGERLTVLDPGVIRGLAVANLPGTVVVEHSASTKDGRIVLVTSPEVDPSYAAFRLFLGPPDRVVERPLRNASRTKGGVTLLEFTLDGQDAQVVFGSSLSPGVESALTVGAQREPLIVDPPGTRPSTARYLCGS
jgi:hypothetical protein